LHRDNFLAPLSRGNWTLPGCCVGQHKRPILPGRYGQLRLHRDNFRDLIKLYDNFHNQLIINNKRNYL